MKKLILKIRFSPGDILMFTSALRDLHKTFPGEFVTDVRSPCPEIFENSPYVTRIEEQEADYILQVQYELIHQSGWRGCHFSEGFYVDLQERLGLIDYIENNRLPVNDKSMVLEYLREGTLGNPESIEFTNNLMKQTEVKALISLRKIEPSSMLPDLHISDTEKVWINHVESEFGYRGKFWLINAGYKPDCELKHYPYWQEVAAILSRHIQIVQIGHASHNHPRLKGVFDLVGKTDNRQLIRLCWHAQGMLGGVTFLMVLAAALEKPYVCVAGGREGARWQMYPYQAFLKTNGWLECCKYDGCWRHKKTECLNLAGGHPKCYQLIPPEQVAEACLNYYKGGRLAY